MAQRSHETVEFESDGQQLVGDLYLPSPAGTSHVGTSPSWLSSAPGSLPGVVMASDLGGVKEMLLPHFAAALSAVGVAVLAFDYANFGASDGSPRQHADLQGQRRAYQDALDYLGGRQDIDVDRLGLWGYGMSGGHSLAVATVDSRVKSTVVLVPFVGMDVSRLSSSSFGSVADSLGRLLVQDGDGEAMVTLVGCPGERAAITVESAGRWLERAAAEAPTYRNELTASSIENVFAYKPVNRVRDIRTPVHVVLVTDDVLTPADAGRAALHGIHNLETIEFPRTYFELFDWYLPNAVDLTTRWFQQDLLPVEQRRG
jgi:fermentation-respiration switch protein FrsA (DUF1100 family)